MLQKFNSKKEEGFTIIETLIVLAIAGLIIVIVLLAVPALQRNSRNTNLKNDASAIAGAISEFESNNGGQVPTVAELPAIANSANTFVVGGTVSGVTTATAKIQTGDNITSGTATGSIPSGTPTNGSIYILTGQNCAGVPSNRSIAIFYTVETATATHPSWTATNCIDS